MAVSHDDDLSQGKISSHVRAKVKIVLMMIFLNGKDHHMKVLQIGLQLILFLLASHWLICLLIGQKLIIVLIPSYWIMCPLIGQWLNLVLLTSHWPKRLINLLLQPSYLLICPLIGQITTYCYYKSFNIAFISCGDIHVTVGVW